MFHTSATAILVYFSTDNHSQHYYQMSAFSKPVSVTEGSFEMGFQPLHHLQLTDSLDFLLLDLLLL